MSAAETVCVLCRGPAGDSELGRVQVWEDALWRLTIATEGEVAGFAYLEPKRHVPHITELQGEEAHTLGRVLAQVTRDGSRTNSSVSQALIMFGSPERSGWSMQAGRYSAGIRSAVVRQRMYLLSSG